VSLLQLTEADHSYVYTDFQYRHYQNTIPVGLKEDSLRRRMIASTPISASLALVPIRIDTGPKSQYSRAITARALKGAGRKQTVRQPPQSVTILQSRVLPRDRESRDGIGEEYLDQDQRTARRGAGREVRQCTSSTALCRVPSR
jgi:hypothetical protein